MAKRGRTVSLDKMISRLKALDRERVALQAGIKAAVASAIGSWSGENPFPWGKGTGGGRESTGAAPGKRRKLSAKARKAISDAQKARWAKQRAGKK